MTGWLENHLIPCFFKSNFGIDCPGCGMQRAFIALLKGEIIESFAYHPALIPFLITLIALFIQIKMKFPKGGIIIMWLFITTSAITIAQFLMKLPVNFH